MLMNVVVFVGIVTYCDCDQDVAFRFGVRSATKTRTAEAARQIVTVDPKYARLFPMATYAQ
jgi:hypothetical protein